MIKIFYTPATQHLAPSIGLPTGVAEFKTFSDGELFVKVADDVANQTVWLIAATNPPADNLLQTLFLINALQRAGARVKLLFTYFGYARQDKPGQGEAATAQLICQIFKNFAVEDIFVIHMHSSALKEFLSFETIIP